MIGCPANGGIATTAATPSDDETGDHHLGDETKQQPQQATDGEHDHLAATERAEEAAVERVEPVADLAVAWSSAPCLLGHRPDLAGATDNGARAIRRRRRAPRPSRRPGRLEISRISTNGEQAASIIAASPAINSPNVGATAAVSTESIVVGLARR